ncbi:hypothetical protein WSS15_20660 [Acetobacter pasteurianus]|uniref:hypothetical protein n=1 Tax=Acetobacter pasteurianus TaxID=438 RepID=UPI0022C4520C|nr:hypothetical protein [Acetobacter pasteurianus]GLH29416.1 hypothetical protein WSS15_20660 [Acetobacter pasteurianus]
MSENTKASFTSYGIINHKEKIILNEGGQLFNANSEGTKADKTFSVNLDDGTNIYAYVNEGKLSFYRSTADDEPGEWIFNLFPNGNIYTAKMKERKKLAKEKNQEQEKPKLSATGRLILTLSKK